LSAPDRDLLVRFFDDLRLVDDGRRQTAPVRDLGPFGAVVVGPHDLRADDRILAVRVSRKAQWMLTDLAGERLEGIPKDALAFVTAAGLAQTRAAELNNQQRLAPTAEALAALADEPVPAVWMDRVHPARDIYVSRPNGSSLKAAVVPVAIAVPIPASEPLLGTWIDRVTPPREIYVSRPNQSSARFVPAALAVPPTLTGDPVTAVWMDRVQPPREIYVSRPTLTRH
jgi:hypothetical protein